MTADSEVDDAHLRRRLETLADELADQGDLRSPQWREAFLAVRRHVFVPRYWHDDEPGAFPARWRMVDRATCHFHEWLDAVYSNRTLATDLTGVPTETGGMHPQVTSSTTMPGLMLSMLEALDIGDGMRVLEIGTGTGYNTALLSERLGDSNVTSIDIDPELVALARIRLAAHGYHPQVVVGDGADGVPRCAPYDRVIATCAVNHIPQAWIDQTRPDGKIMTNLRGPFAAHALITLTASGDGTASGKFVPQRGSFMPMRDDPTSPFDYTVRIPRGNAEPRQGHTTLDPREAYQDQTWGLLAQTCLNDLMIRQIYVGDQEQLGTELASPDGSSWAIVHHTPDNDGHRTEQAGPRRTWNKLEKLHNQWTTLGRPSYHRFGLTLGNDRQNLWLDHPGSDHNWNRESRVPRVPG